MYIDQDISSYDKETMQRELHEEIHKRSEHLQESWNEQEDEPLRISIRKDDQGLPFVKISSTQQLFWDGNLLEAETTSTLLPNSHITALSINGCTEEIRQLIAHHLLFKHCRKKLLEDEDVSDTYEPGMCLPEPDGSILALTESIREGTMDALPTPVRKEKEGNTTFHLRCTIHCFKNCAKTYLEKMHPSSMISYSHATFILGSAE